MPDTDKSCCWRLWTEQLLAITTVCILCYHFIKLFTSFFIGRGLCDRSLLTSHSMSKEDYASRFIDPVQQVDDRECEGSDSHQEVDSHDQDLLMVLLCYHFIKLFTSFFIGRGSSWKREEGPICKPCVSTRGSPIADSTASDTTIAEDTMIDEFPQDEEADVNQYISVWRSY